MAPRRTVPRAAPAPIEDGRTHVAPPPGTRRSVDSSARLNRRNRPRRRRPDARLAATGRSRRPGRSARPRPGQGDPPAVPSLGDAGDPLVPPDRVDRARRDDAGKGQPTAGGADSSWSSSSAVVRYPAGNGSSRLAEVASSAPNTGGSGTGPSVRSSGPGAVRDDQQDRPDDVVQRAVEGGNPDVPADSIFPARASTSFSEL